MAFTPFRYLTVPARPDFFYTPRLAQTTDGLRVINCPVCEQNAPIVQPNLAVCHPCQVYIDVSEVADK